MLLACHMVHQTMRVSNMIFCNLWFVKYICRLATKVIIHDAVPQVQTKRSCKGGKDSLILITEADKSKL